MDSVQVEFFSPPTPRRCRHEGSTDPIALGFVPYSEMNVSIDSRRCKRGMAQVFSECADGQVRDTDVWGLQGFELAHLERHFETKPVGVERSNVLVSDLEFRVLRNPSGEQVV